MTLITKCCKCGKKLEICHIIHKGDKYYVKGKVEHSKRYYCSEDCLTSNEVAKNL